MSEDDHSLTDINNKNLKKNMLTTNNIELQELFKEHLANDNKRLDRIEYKIDKLSETVVSLARVEEKVNSLNRDSARTNDGLVKLESRLEVVEGKVDNNNVTVKIINNIFWIGLTAFAGSIIAWFFTR
tara:strand:+ start:279 stop:662 length:384 start_codon:yes stop_codon:yes gene_type:complete